MAAVFGSHMRVWPAPKQVLLSLGCVWSLWNPVHSHLHWTAGAMHLGLQAYNSACTYRALQVKWC